MNRPCLSASWRIHPQGKVNFKHGKLHLTDGLKTALRFMSALKSKR